MVKSLPSRERGLKYAIVLSYNGDGTVAPLAGAWIEITKITNTLTDKRVAPLAGAWIEIFAYLAFSCKVMSLPSREHGLKFLLQQVFLRLLRRSPRGGVD